MADAYNAADWASLAGAQVSAAAALAGVVFVAVSISLRRILAFPSLPLRALKALLMPVSVLVVFTLVLIPGQATSVLAIELLLAGLISGTSNVAIDARIMRSDAPDYQTRRLAFASLGLTAGASIALAGATLLFEQGGGLYWLIPGLLLAYFSALTDAWVLLIEVMR
jgi:modulator of FtsH protease